MDLTDHRVTYMHGSTTKTVAARDLTPLKAIRAKCLDCSAGSARAAVVRPASAARMPRRGPDAAQDAMQLGGVARRRSGADGP